MSSSVFHGGLRLFAFARQKSRPNKGQTHLAILPPPATMLPAEEPTMKKPKYDFHPICLLFPRMTDEELRELADDLRIKGLLHDIVLYEGKILDGRNRYLACPMAGVEPRFSEWDGEGSPLEWVISENMVRRHLTSSQRAVLALELLPMLEQEAAERMRRGPTIRKNLRMVGGNGEAREIAARMTNSNAAYVQLLKAVRTQAPELLDRVRDGILRVPDAAKLAKLSRSERKGVLRLCDGKPVKGSELRDVLRQAKNDVRHRAAQAFARSSKSVSTQNVLVGDMAMLHDRLEDDSVDFFLTDPPYADVDSYERLAELAAAKLRPSGLCLAYAGQFHLSEIMEAMGKHLRYWWMIAIEFSGQHCAIHPRRVQNKWKPILAFAKPPVKKAPNWLSDHLDGGGRDKEHHDWGQDQSEVEYLIEKLTEPGQLVVDPFCGGGTIPAACKLLGRRWLATEKDRNTALVARKRLAEMSRSKRKRAG